MKPALALVAPVVLALAVCCTHPSSEYVPTIPLASSNTVLRLDRLGKMTGATALDALHTLPSYLSRTMRQPGPRFLLILDGMRTSSLQYLENIQATDVYEIRVIGESQSLETQSDVQIVVTTVAAHDRGR
jgi:hypothetical protein